MIWLRLTTEYTYNILSILELNRTQTKGKMRRKCCVSFVFHVDVVWIDGRRQTTDEWSNAWSIYDYVKMYRWPGIWLASWQACRRYCLWGIFQQQQQQTGCNTAQVCKIVHITLLLRLFRPMLLLFQIKQNKWMSQSEKCAIYLIWMEKGTLEWCLVSMCEISWIWKMNYGCNEHFRQITTRKIQLFISSRRVNIS